MKELSRVVREVDDRVRELGEAVAPAEYEAVADGLWNAFVTARELAPARPRTGCGVHPHGPVDPLAPEGWTHCLLCNRNRRISDPSVPSADTTTESRWPGAGRGTPGPPFTRATLAEVMGGVTELVFDLGHDASDEELAALAERVHRAFVVARELSRPRGGSGCARHPGAPVDPTAAETGGTSCLFCRGEEVRRGRQGPPVPRARRPRPRRRIGPRFMPPPGGAGPGVDPAG